MARFVRAPRVFVTVEAAAALVELAMAGITTHAEYNAVLESIQNAALAPPAQQQQQQHQLPTPSSSSSNISCPRLCRSFGHSRASKRCLVARTCRT